MGSVLEAVVQKVEGGERLTREDGIALYALQGPDIIRLGRLAGAVKRKLWGDKAHFVLNRQINPSNVCVLSCRFCDFASKRGRDNAYEMTLEEVVARCSDELHEVHIVAGLHPDWKWEFYLDMFRAIKRRYPQIQIKAWTAVEIDYFSKKFRLSVQQVLDQFREVGLVALPGGGAEIFSERVRKALFPFKMGAPRWLEIHRIAHGMGIPTNATMLFGHMETIEERVEHMIKLRELQDETRGFMSFIPLVYQPGKTKVVEHETSAVDDLKTIAISRLLLDNVPHIKAYWVTMGEESASVALQFGADDIDGTIGEERIMHAAEAGSPASLTRDRLIQLIREAGCVPVERDAVYETIRVYEDNAYCENTVS